MDDAFEGSTSRRGALATGLAAGALAAWPLLPSLLFQGSAAAFEWFAADAFYYFAVADGALATGTPTFDGSRPVNGFHPAWFAGLVAAFAAAGESPEARLTAALGLSVALVALGTSLFALAVLARTRSPSLALLASVPGFYAWLSPPPAAAYGTTWSFANGMETALSVALFGLVAFLLLARGWSAAFTPGRRVTLSALVTLLVLARLDDVFLLVAFLAWLVREAPAGERRSALLQGSLAPAIVLAAYLVVNLGYAGAALPLSGAAKASGLVDGFLRNGYALLTTALPFADVRDVDGAVWAGEAYRVWQLLVPAGGALAWLLWRARGGTPELAAERSTRSVLVALAGYVLLKALYNLVFVGIWHQGHWYFPLSILTLNLLAADALAPLLRRFTTPGPLRSALPVLCFAWIWVAGTAFAAARSIHPVHGRSFAFFSGRVAIEAELERRCPGCGVVSFDDGVVAFSLDRPVLNGLGLVLDREAFDARRDGRLLELARERGFELLTTVNYPFATELDSASLRDVLARYPHLRDEPLDRFDFEIVWREPESGAVFVRFSPGEPARAGSAPPSEASRPRGA